MWNKHERDGKFDQAKGRAKQAVGDLTGNKTLKAEGQMDEAGARSRRPWANSSERPWRQSRR